MQLAMVDDADAEDGGKVEVNGMEWSIRFVMGREGIG